MTHIDELKAAVSTKDTRIGELEASLRAKDAMIVELRGRVAELEKSGPKTAAKTKKRVVEKKPAAPPKPATKKRKAAPDKKPAKKKKKTQKIDETCPLESVIWTVKVIDEDDEEEEETYASKNPISNTILKTKAPRAGAKWFTIRERRDTVELYPWFNFKNGDEYDHEEAEVGSFEYEDAMKVIRDHKAGRKRGPPTIHYEFEDPFRDINGGINLELRKAKKKGELQFRFVDAEVEIFGPENYYGFPWVLGMD